MPVSQPVQYSSIDLSGCRRRFWSRWQGWRPCAVRRLLPSHRWRGSRRRSSVFGRAWTRWVARSWGSGWRASTTGLGGSTGPGSGGSVWWRHRRRSRARSARCRRSEVRNNIGADALNLGDSKAGPRTVPLGASGRVLIEALPGRRDTDAFLCPRHAEGRGIWILTTFWRTACVDMKLGRLRLHDLRHTAVSPAIMSGENPPRISKLLGLR